MTDYTTGGESRLSQPDEESSENKWRFRLYVFGANQNSLHALGNLFFICRSYLKDNFEVDVVDLRDDPLRAFEDKILVTPTLVKLAPAPSVTIIGTLDDRVQILIALEIDQNP